MLKLQAQDDAAAQTSVPQIPPAIESPQASPAAPQAPVNPDPLKFPDTVEFNEQKPLVSKPQNSLPLFKKIQEALEGIFNALVTCEKALQKLFTNYEEKVRSPIRVIKTTISSQASKAEAGQIKK